MTASDLPIRCGACLDSKDRDREKSVSDKVNCDLEHVRAARAVVRLQIKSTRLGRAGHPVVRVLGICARHARQLRELGLELVEA